MILLQSDDPTLGEGLAQAQRRLTTSEDLLANLRETPSQLLILDEPPVELLGRLRSDEASVRRTVVVLAPTAARSDYYRADADVCLSKPVDGSQVRLAVDNAASLTGKAFDYDSALQAMGHADVVKAVVQAFLEEGRRLFDEVAAARSQGSPALAKAAHRFAGGIAAFGPSPCHRRSLELERLAAAAEPTEDAYFLFQESFERLEAVMQAL